MTLPLALPSPSPATDEEALVALLRRQTEEVVSLVVRTLPTAPSLTRSLSTLESYCAAMRGVLADIEEPPTAGRRKRHGDYEVDDGEIGGMFPNGPPGALGGPLAALEPFFDKLVQVQKANAEPHPSTVVSRLADSLASLEKVEGVEDIRARLRRQLDEATQGGSPVLELGILPTPMAPLTMKDACLSV